jgi:non-homologous end joining protein Ku
LLRINQEKELTKEKIQDLKQQLITKNSKNKSTSKLVKDKLKEKIQEIIELDLERKKNQHSNTYGSEDSPIHPLTFP